MANKKQTCIRCEALERKQQSKIVYDITNPIGDKIPLCAVCIVEMKDEEDFFGALDKTLEDDELGSESID